MNTETQVIVKLTFERVISGAEYRIGELLGHYNGNINDPGFRDELQMLIFDRLIDFCDANFEPVAKISMSVEVQT
jgi:hypothetical protein